MKHLVAALSLVVATAAVAQSPGGGGISAKSVMPELRTRTIRIDGQEHRVLDEDDKNASGTTILNTTAAIDALVPGVLGVMKVGTAAATVDFTTGFAPPPMPSKLKVYLLEGSGAAAAVTCSLTLFGFDQFGSSISETVAVAEIVVTEHSASNRTTTKVFEKLTRVKGTCTNTESTDRIVITGSHIIGLPLHISGVDAVKQICYTRNSTKFSIAGANGVTADNICLVGGAADGAPTTTAQGTFDNAGTSNRIDLSVNSIDLSAVNSGLIATTGSISAGGSGGTTLRTAATITLRAPNGSK